MKAKFLDILSKTGNKWVNLSFYAKWKLLLITFCIMLIPGIISLIKIFQDGLGMLPLNNSVVWGTFIVNFIFWIGIAHAGTFISAFLLLLRQNWRHEIHRFAESMTIIAILVAALMPVFHLGKPLLFYKLFPFSDYTGLILINFNSPIIWDFYAILTYLLVSFIFLGSDYLPEKMLIFKKKPSLETTQHKFNFLQFNLLSKNQYYLAILATPLVISVHSIVSYDFAVSLRAGWHNSIFPVYFVVGAIMSGFAMIGLWLPFAAKHPSFKNLISVKHLIPIKKIIIGCSVFLSFVFLNELLGIANSSHKSEIWQLMSKLKSGSLVVYLISVSSTLILPHLLWKNKFKSVTSRLQWICLLILIGMWLERFVIVVGSSTSSELPAQFTTYSPNLISLGLNSGIIALFSVMFLLVIRYLPLISYHKSGSQNLINHEEEIILIFNSENDFQNALSFLSESQIMLTILPNENDILAKNKTAKFAFLSILISFPLIVLLQYIVHKNHNLVLGEKPVFSILSFIPVALVLSLLVAAIILFFSLLYKIREKTVLNDNNSSKYQISLKRENYLLVKAELSAFNSNLSKNN